jgi:hypothetical protein
MTAIAFQTKLKSDTVHLPDIDGLIGKDVIITVVEIEKDKPTRKRRWKHVGDLDLNKKFDKVNIRDFAYK